jgi:hypothetical protein
VTVDHLPRASIFVAISANLWRMTWNLPIWRPNAVRSLRVCSVMLEAALGARDAARGADQALALELPHDVVEALADLAEDRRLGTRTSWKASSAVSDACMPSFCRLLLADHAGRVHRDEEEREAVVARRPGRSW